MGQIFDRIRTLADAWMADTHRADTQWADTLLHEADDDLRRAIEDAVNSTGDPSSFSTRDGTSNMEGAKGAPADVLRAHDVLATTPTTPPQELRRAYVRAIAQWHPDRFVNASSEQQDEASRRSRDINAAWIVLKTWYRLP